MLRTYFGLTCFFCYDVKEEYMYNIWILLVLLCSLKYGGRLYRFESKMSILSHLLLLAISEGHEFSEENRHLKLLLMEYFESSEDLIYGCFRWLNLKLWKLHLCEASSVPCFRELTGLQDHHGRLGAGDSQQAPQLRPEARHRASGEGIICMGSSDQYLKSLYCLEKII